MKKKHRKNLLEFLGLVKRVSAINLQAGIWLAEEAPKMKEFKMTGYLGTSFVWEDSPQKHEFWRDINIMV